MFVVNMNTQKLTTAQQHLPILPLSAAIHRYLLKQKRMTAVRNRKPQASQNVQG
jgi:hypothetical protein